MMCLYFFLIKSEIPKIKQFYSSTPLVVDSPLKAELILKPKESPVKKSTAKGIVTFI